MSRTRSRTTTTTGTTRWAAAACAAAMTLAGCSGGSGSTAATDEGQPTTAVEDTEPTLPPQPPPPPPAVGECRNVSFADIALYSNASRPRECSGAHSAYTFAVKKLPSDVAFDGVAIENDAIQSAAADACNEPFARFIGGGAADQALSRLTPTYFLPDQKGFDLGAHWVRCDVVALQSTNSLGDLPRRIEGYLDGDGALVDYGLCSRGDPGAEGAELVMCSQEHTFRAVEALSLGNARAAYPGRDETLDRGTKRCEAIVGEIVGAGSGFTYAWTFPTTEEWAAGARFGYCWAEQTD